LKKLITIKMDAKERLIRTISHEEPDKVPYHENLIQNPGLAKKVNMGAESNLKMYNAVDAKYVRLRRTHPFEYSSALKPPSVTFVLKL